MKMTSIYDLPREIILKIFQMYLETENQWSLMKIIYNVCPDWENICFDSSLWTNFDGTVPFKIMMKLCEAGSLKNTKQFTLSKVKTLKDIAVDKLFSELKKVKGINITNLETLTTNILSGLENNCPYLNDIQFGKFKDSAKTINYDNLISFLSVRGSNLLSINLSYCLIKQLSLALRCIADCCNNLEELQLVFISGSYVVFPTKYFQQRCTKLKELHLDYNVTLGKEKHDEGFPNLEVFTFGNPSGTAITDKELECVVFNSLNLKFLDLTNSDISANILRTLPAANLQSLHVARSKICNSKHLPDVLTKWCSSLKQVDISYASSYLINKAVMDLVLTPVECQLEDLNLSYTKVTASVVDTILHKCNKLHQLRLESCRSLGRGMKKIYYGKSELSMLSESLKSFMGTKTRQ